MSYVDHIIGFLLDEHRRLSSKATVVVFIVLAILLIDNALGFSYYYGTNKKVEQIQKLNSIIKDSTSDSTTKMFALNLRSEILKRENVIIYSISFFQNIKWTTSTTSQTNSPEKTSKSNSLILKNIFWFHLTAGGLWYLMALIMIPIILFNDKTTSLPQRLASGLLAAALFFGFGWLFYLLCSFIPQIVKTSWAWNYITNFLIQVSLIMLLVMVGRKKK